jgi:hypothetical protein
MLQTAAWRTVRDTVEVQEFLARRWPSVDHPGGRGWEWAIGQLPAETLLARSEGAVVGWAGVTDGQLTIQAPDDRQAGPHAVGSVPASSTIGSRSIVGRGSRSLSRGQERTPLA